MARNRRSVTLLGIQKETNGYYFYNPIEHKLFIARHAVFLEKEFISKGTSGSMVKLEEVLLESNTEPVTEAVAEDVPQRVVEQSAATTVQAPRRSSRIRHQTREVWTSRDKR